MKNNPDRPLTWFRAGDGLKEGRNITVQALSHDGPSIVEIISSAGQL